MAFDLRDFLQTSRRDTAAAETEPAPGGPLGGTRAESIQRLQVGVLGIGAMILLVGLADIVGSRIQETEASAVPEAAPTVAATETAPARDPLVEAGVAPALPTTPEPTESSAPQREATEDVPEPSSNAQLQ